MEKIEAMESEIKNNPAVLKDFEMLEVCRSLSKPEVLPHCTQFEDTEYNLKVDDVIYHVRREKFICSVEKETRTALIKEVVDIGDVQQNLVCRPSI